MATHRTPRSIMARKRPRRDFDFRNFRFKSELRHAGNMHAMRNVMLDVYILYSNTNVAPNTRKFDINIVPDILRTGLFFPKTVIIFW